MQRREMLSTTAAAALGLSAFPLGWAAAAEKKMQKILYFTRSIQYEHSVIASNSNGPGYSGKILIELGKKAGFEVDVTKDGRVFDGDLDQYDAIVTYLCGNMSQPSVRKTPPVSAAGKKRLVDIVAAGKPFVGLHSSCYWGSGVGVEDPYLAMVGASFIAHGAQQESGMTVTSPNFPGIKGIDKSFRLVDEWYAMKEFADDLHVILSQDTTGMKGAMYQRPAFPATWARKHGKGRVFYCSMGHREDVWTNKTFQQILLGGMAWSLGNVDADITPNVKQVTPKADQLTK